MNIIIAIVLVILGIGLFVFARKDKTLNDSIHLSASIASILVFFAAILSLAVPWAFTTNTSESLISTVTATIALATTTKEVNLLPPSTIVQPNTSIFPSPTPSSISPGIIIFKPTESTILGESDHPYADNYKQTWIFFEDGANQIRIHFFKLEIYAYDTFRLLDKDDNKLIEWCCNTVYSNGLWTDWYPGDTIKFQLNTSGGINGYGFAVDKVETKRESEPNNSTLPETFHPYANNYTGNWSISVPGVNQIRIHFSRLEIVTGDSLRLFDKDGEIIAEWCCNSVDYDGLWTEWYSGDTFKLQLNTSGGINGYGFAVDKVETK